MTNNGKSTHRNLQRSRRPELHATAETGVLEAPAGAVMVNGALHIFHQFRPRPQAGSRWAHQYSPDLPFGWDVCDDVLAPTGDEIDVLAGSSVALPGTDTVELFFATTHAEHHHEGDGQDSSSTVDTSVLGNAIDHGVRGPRKFRIQRAKIEHISDAVECSDDPNHLQEGVERLGAITLHNGTNATIDVNDLQLVTPSVIYSPEDTERPWLMIALSLLDETAAEIVVLRSPDREHWDYLGPLDWNTDAFVGGEEDIPTGRPFAPRIIVMQDEETGQSQHVLFLTYPTEDSLDGSATGEVTGYVVGSLAGATFHVAQPFRVLDFGYDFTRPRVVQTDRPILFALVGAHPNEDDRWANCLSSPRYISLHNGEIHQRIEGAAKAVKHYSDHALLWNTAFDVSAGGEVVAEVKTDTGTCLLEVRCSPSEVRVTRNGDEPCVAPIDVQDTDGSLSIFVDGPLCEVFVNGGALTFTLALYSSVTPVSPDGTDSHGNATSATTQTAPTLPHGPALHVSVRTEGAADVAAGMTAYGRELQLQLAGVTYD